MRMSAVDGIAALATRITRAVCVAGSQTRESRSSIAASTPVAAGVVLSGTGSPKSDGVVPR